MNRIESLGVVKQAGYRYCMLSKFHKREKKKSMLSAGLLKFLIESHVELLQAPLDGHLRDIYALFVKRQLDQDGTSIGLNGPRSHTDFWECLMDISKVCRGAIVFVEEESPLSGDPFRIESIDVFPLMILLRKLQPDLKGDTRNALPVSTTRDKPRTDKGDTSKLERVLSLLDSKNEDSSSTYDRYSIPSSKYLYNKLQSLLKVEPQSYQLARERAKVTEPIKPYIPICTNPNHRDTLANIALISNDKIVSIQTSKLSMADEESLGLLECISTKVHYVPNIKPYTDVTLGDCFYLDTCHKLNTCRYIHYLQYIPESLMNKVENEANLQTEDQLNHYPLYTHGEPCSLGFKNPVIPAQWIRCDILSFDFTILGKFSAIIADPPWNINNNNSNTSNSGIELLEQPLRILQDEGVVFLWVTGRAIELGKSSLTTWGYKIVNEISWIKTNQLGRTIVTGRTGHWLNHSKEHLLVGVKGDAKWVNRHIDVDLIVSGTRETSRKPDELYGMVERLVGRHARKLEMFGKDHNTRPGWVTIGNQLTGTVIYELDVKRRYEKWIASRYAMARG